MTLFCIGFAIYYPVVFASSLEIFPEMKGTASSAIMSMRAILSFIMIGWGSYLYNGHPLSISMGHIICHCRWSTVISGQL